MPVILVIKDGMFFPGRCSFLQGRLCVFCIRAPLLWEDILTNPALVPALVLALVLGLAVVPAVGAGVGAGVGEGPGGGGGEGQQEVVTQEADPQQQEVQGQHWQPGNQGPHVITQPGTGTYP